MVLRGAIGKGLSTRIDLDVGQRLLRGIVGDDAKYASELQFRLVRRSLEGWVLEAAAGTTNETWHNGAPVAARTTVVLRPGDEISLRGRRATVRIEFDQ